MKRPASIATCVWPWPTSLSLNSAWFPSFDIFSVIELKSITPPCCWTTDFASNAGTSSSMTLIRTTRQPSPRSGSSTTITANLLKSDLPGPNLKRSFSVTVSGTTPYRSFISAQ